MSTIYFDGGGMTAGMGLPQVTMDRIARASASGVRTSLRSVPSAVSAPAVRLSPMGKVMGCIVRRIGWLGWGRRGYWGNGYRDSGATTFG